MKLYKIQSALFDFMNIQQGPHKRREREQNKMKKAKKLNIRINFVTPVDNAAKEEAGYIYHWQRIIGATLLLAITVAVLAGCVFNYLNQPVKPTQETKAVITTPFNSVKESSIAIQSVSKTAISNSDNKGTETAVIDENKNKTLTAQPKTAPDVIFTAVDTTVFSAHIKRFVISKAVISKEPVGSIDDIVFDANNIATVYAYSDAVGLKDKTLYYKWSLDGKAIAKVKVGVWSNRWRSYSRKFIRPHMHGDWQVALFNGKGEMLAVHRFHY
ncbi:MAG: hypothetical protein ACJAT7_002828 [Psychromonas sp.]|uniref:DUF2914 domain-containing protein n=1 Tax=Psychromonas sp. TaxID=1884585 RepID=UPI0039E313DA